MGTTLIQGTGVQSGEEIFYPLYNFLLSKSDMNPNIHRITLLVKRPQHNLCTSITLQRDFYLCVLSYTWQQTFANRVISISTPHLAQAWKPMHFSDEAVCVLTPGYISCNIVTPGVFSPTRPSWPSWS